MDFIFSAWFKMKIRKLLHNQKSSNNSYKEIRMKFLSSSSFFISLEEWNIDVFKGSCHDKFILKPLLSCAK